MFQLWERLPYIRRLLGVVSKYYPQRCLLRSDKSMATNTSTNTAMSRCAGSTEALINAHQSENARTRAAQTGRSRGKMKMKEEQCGVSGSPESTNGRWSKVTTAWLSNTLPKMYSPECVQALSEEHIKEIVAGYPDEQVLAELTR